MWFCMLLSAASLFFASVSDASQPKHVFRQTLNFISQDHFRLSKSRSVKTDCEYAASVIRAHSRPEAGLVLKSRCQYLPSLQDYMVKTEVLITAQPKKKGGFIKTTSRVHYPKEFIARYAARVLKELNFKECDVLIDPTQRGTEVALDTVALVSSPKRSGR